LYAGHLDDDARRRAAAALAGHIRPGDVLIASSDFTHYGASFQHLPFPADYDLVPRLHELDEGYLEAAGSLSPSLFLAALREKEATVCGHAPVALLLETLQQLGAEDIFQQTLDYQTSAEITGDRDHSVSYAALGYFHAGSFYLDEADQRTLLDCARATLRHLSREGGRRAVPPETAGPALQRRAGAFVSLHHGEQLFGCIGMRAARQPLAQMIPELTLSAALDDPRFHHHGAIPADLQLEISILTPSKRIPDPGLFRLGRDGATLETGGRAGLLLPQVAGGTINSETRFLEALSRKTGCAPDAYRDPEARLSVFRAQVFS
jgi:AmmeMemoRadiSam system protein A